MSSLWGLGPEAAGAWVSQVGPAGRLGCLVGCVLGQPVLSGGGESGGTWTVAHSPPPGDGFPCVLPSLK